MTAIYFEEDVPSEWKDYVQVNRDFFKNVPAEQRTFRPRTERTRADVLTQRRLQHRACR